MPLCVRARVPMSECVCTRPSVSVRMCVRAYVCACACSHVRVRARARDLAVRTRVRTRVRVCLGVRAHLLSRTVGSCERFAAWRSSRYLVSRKHGTATRWPTRAHALLHTPMPLSLYAPILSHAPAYVRTCTACPTDQGAADICYLSLPVLLLVPPSRVATGLCGWLGSAKRAQCRLLLRP